MELQDWRKEPRKNYSNEFKLRMVELASQPGACVAQIARENGVNDNVIFKWLRLWQNEGRVSRRLPVTTSSDTGVELLPVEITPDEQKEPVAAIAPSLSTSTQTRVSASSCNYSESKVDMAEQLNRKLKGWAMFYQFVDFKAKVFSYIDRVVFWKLAHWLARKYRTGIASLMRWWCKSPKPGQSKTWVLFGKTNHGKLSGEILYRLVGQGKKLFRWRLPEGNPYLRTETRNTYTSRFTEVAMAFASI